MFLYVPFPQLPEKLVMYRKKHDIWGYCIKYQDFSQDCKSNGLPT